MIDQPKTLSILITDDIEDNRKWIADILYSIAPQASIQEAENGAMAIQVVSDKIQQEKRSFDLIIMDFKMPILNGEKATEGIRDVEKNAHIAKISTIITWSSAKSCAYPLGDDWLPKLTTKQEVEQMMREFNLI